MIFPCVRLCGFDSQMFCSRPFQPLADDGTACRYQGCFLGTREVPSYRSVSGGTILGEAMLEVSLFRKRGTVIPAYVGICPVQHRTPASLHPPSPSYSFEIRYSALNLSNAYASLVSCFPFLLSASTSLTNASSVFLAALLLPWTSSFLAFSSF